ncbi:MAG: 30S ribosomal protein S20 [Planctomycetota bacterium]|nr:30S ribosomal protein S20 [Planctomycetota bacterium]
MPNSESAKKRVRQNIDRSARNRWRRTKVKDETKLFLKAIHDGDKSAAEKSLRLLSGMLDRFALTPTMHHNTAARRKSRLAKRLNKLTAAKSA